MPSGLETPSGMTTAVSTVAGGLEMADFLELRENSTRAASEAVETAGPRSLYHVVPEKQTSVRGLMGSERGYDVSAVAGARSLFWAMKGDEGRFLISLWSYLCFPLGCSTKRMA
jgi:splicing factor 3B subunit 2